jgi:carbonic anhydrase/acetyltransferase-like protein (isoleucine patch superfamily)
MLLPYLHYTPQIAAPFQLAPTAAIAGRVTAGPGLVMLGRATLRADGEAIRIGRNAFFAERATVHIVDGVLPAELGDDATVGRYALVHACTLGDGVVVGDAAVVMDGAVVGARVLIAPGALVPPRKRLDGGALYAGSPAVRVRDVGLAELAAAAQAIRNGADLPLVRNADLPALDNRAYAPAGFAGDGLAPQGGRAPRFTKAWSAPTALVAGDVALAADAGIYFACAVVAGGAAITIGAATNVQDNAILVTDRARGDLVIGSGVTIGHNVRVGAGAIGDDALIGMGATLADGVVVEAGACVGGRSLVLPGTVVRSGWIWAGRPAKAFREIRPDERQGFARAAEVYVRYTRAYRAADFRAAE